MERKAWDIRTRSKLAECCAAGQCGSLISARWNWPEGLAFFIPQPANRLNGAKRSSEKRAQVSEMINTNISMPVHKNTQTEDIVRPSKKSNARTMQERSFGQAVSLPGFWTTEITAISRGSSRRPSWPVSTAATASRIISLTSPKWSKSATVASGSSQAIY